MLGKNGLALDGKERGLALWRLLAMLITPMLESLITPRSKDFVFWFPTRNPATDRTLPCHIGRVIEIACVNIIDDSDVTSL